ncbi:aldo/keto reductase [Lacibacter sediminis]|uniref:Aldo/keto reductase n=1 Tax=Lacibacter sediminis TaxID=2760713 RepID=A0A7G5XIQ7_9BACT|nr:aldo/keto reductase [Lacibacter sediminis]QNA45360.1 aldo/keto reductase [Lacibacter sediminis]
MIYSNVIAGTMKWGAWGAKFTTASFEQMIKDCIAVGVTTFDHADIYGDYTTEEDFGKVLKEQPSLRQQMQIITKCGIQIVSVNRPHHKIKSYDTSYEHIMESVEQSLKNLSTDYIDCLLIHRPDPLFNADEVAKAFEQLKQQGKVLEFGVSNFRKWQVDLLRSRFPVSVNQVECSLLHLEPFGDGTLDQCQQHGMIPMAWSPMGGGNLFVEDDEDERNKRIIAVANILAEKYATGADVILLSWLMTHPTNILPVLGTSKIERIHAAVAATLLKLEREEWFMLWRASTGREVA